MRDQPGFFDVDDRLKRLSDLGDQIIAAPGGCENFEPRERRKIATPRGREKPRRQKISRLRGLCDNFEPRDKRERQKET